MKKSTITIIILLILITLTAAGYFLLKKTDTELEFEVTDKNSKSWVWDLTVTLQNRIIRGYYQSDKAPFPFQFTHLTPGTWELKLSAPSYLPVTIPVTIKKGKNVLPVSIEMEGYEIPDFKRFYVFNKHSGNDLVFELRQVNAENQGIKNHPCLDLWIGCKIYTQVIRGINVTVPVESGSETGELLFKGKIPWEWNVSPGIIYRYTARLHNTLVKKSTAPYWAAELLIIIPDPGQISRDGLDKLMNLLLDQENRNEQEQILQTYSNKLHYHLDQNWNIPALQ